MNRRPWLALPLLLAVFLAGCLNAEPSPSPTATATLTPGPTATLAPTASASPTPTVVITPTASASPIPTPSPSPTATATAPPAPVSAELAAQLQAVLDAERVRREIPGISATVILPDNSFWHGVSGVASLASGREVTTDTPFVSGSVTKTFITATLMALADESRLSLDSPLYLWLPDYPRADQISLRALLSHTSGVYNYFEHSTYNRLVFGNDSRRWTPNEILNTFAAPPYCDPDTCYHYSNTGFILLGKVIEKVTGNDLGAELRERWFDPLGLSDTYFQGEEELPDIAADASEGHLYRPAAGRIVEVGDDSDYRPTISAATVAWAAGGIVATPADLATWCRALYGGSLLPAADLAALTDYAANPLSGGAYGLGTRTRLLDNRRMYGHTGSLRGFDAAMWHFPVENVTVVVETNLGRIDPNPIVDAIARVALTAAGYPPPTPSPVPTFSAVPTFVTPTPIPLPTSTPAASPSP